MRPWGNAVALAVVGAFAVGACSSGGDDASQTSTAVVTATSEATTASTTQAPTTLPPATEAPTTTIDLAEAFAADVEAALLETFRLTDEAIQDPTNDAKVEAALAGYTGDALDVIAARFEEFRLNNWATRPNPEVPAASIVENKPVPNGTQTDAFVVQVCEVNSWIIVEPGAGPDESDAIVDPELLTYRSLFLLELEQNGWQVSAGERLGEWPGVVKCPPE